LIFSTKNVSFNYLKFGDLESSIPILFLHGFLGSSKNWNEIILKTNFPSIPIDLPGHGETRFLDLNNPYDFKIWINDFYQFINFLKLDKFYLCGYSMGGRLAISFANSFPEKIAGLILESTTPGLNNKKDRENRILNDKNYINDILKDYKKFVFNWGQLSLFNNQKYKNPIGCKLQNHIRLNQDPIQIAHSLKALGTGMMKPYWGNISSWDFPILLVTGRKDEKFTNIAKLMVKKNSDIECKSINNLSHNIHLENPSIFSEILNSFLATI